MGWSTDLFCNINFHKETYNSLYEVEEKIDEYHHLIDICKSTLRKLAYMTEFDKFYNKDDYNNADDYLSRELHDSLDELEDYYHELFKLEYLRDNWDACHNKEGLAINPPEDIKWNSAYLSGDFVNSVKYPNANRVL